MSYTCTECKRLIPEDEPRVVYKKHHYHFTCWYALKELPEIKDDEVKDDWDYDSNNY